MSDNINWLAIRTAAASVGVREAARQATANLSLEEQKRFENRCLQRSSREGWIADKEQAIANVQAKSSNVISGPEIVANSLAKQKHKSQSLLAKYVVNAAKVASRHRSPLEIASKVRDVATTREKVWPEEKGSTGFTLNLGILNQSVK